MARKLVAKIYLEESSAHPAEAAVEWVDKNLDHAMVADICDEIIVEMEKLRDQSSLVLGQRKRK